MDKPLLGIFRQSTDRLCFKIETEMQHPEKYTPRRMYHILEKMK
jgi:hypothetical protein